MLPFLAARSQGKKFCSSVETTHPLIFQFSDGKLIAVNHSFLCLNTQGLRHTSTEAFRNARFAIAPSADASLDIYSVSTVWREPTRIILLTVGSEMIGHRINMTLSSDLISSFTSFRFSLNRSTIWLWEASLLHIPSLTFIFVHVRTH